VNDRIVEALEELLRMARRGEVDLLAFGVKHRGGDVHGTLWSSVLPGDSPAPAEHREALAGVIESVCRVLRE
jgi:hypothetical protein